jgi:membrane-associated HD superfamily phosphohydrolase
MRTSILAAIIAGAALVSGCANNEEPARAALASAEASLAEVRVDAAKYAPEQLRQVETRLARVKDDLAKEEYTDALGGATQVTKETATLKEVVTAKQTQAVAATHEWEALSEEVPKMVQAIENRVDSLSGAKLPKDLDKESFESAKATLESMKSLWAEASAAFEAGNAILAADKARMVQAKGEEVIDQLGMSPV